PLGRVAEQVALRRDGQAVRLARERVVQGIAEEDATLDEELAQRSPFHRPTVANGGGVPRVPRPPNKLRREPPCVGIQSENRRALGSLVASQNAPPVWPPHALRRGALSLRRR